MLLSVSKTKELMVEAKTHPSTSVALSCSKSTVQGFWELPLLRNHHGQKQEGKSWSMSMFNFFREVIKSTPTGNITDSPKTGSLYVTGAHLQSISDVGEVRCLHGAKRIRKDKHSAAV